MGAFGCWGSGGFHGDQRDENVAKFVAEDIVLDATSPLKNTDGFKVQMLIFIMN